MAFDPKHVVTIDPYGGECTCGRMFRTHTAFGIDANRGHNLAKANARRHEESAAKKYDAEKANN